jgi:hypothetical protein
MSEETVSIEKIKSLFRYDAEKGQLFWVERPDEDFPTEMSAKMWNTKFSGKLAGYVNGQNNRRVIRIRLDGLSSNYLAYRLIWAIHHGAWPEFTIDHIDGDQSNDRIQNLRDVPFQENCKNLAIQTNNKSGVRGVNWDSVKGKWQARVQEKSCEIWLGYFDEFEHAVIARKAAERALKFHPNHGRPAPTQRSAA